ncbi:hypothetical protein [Nonomuraea sp. LPB2021202275-12-8]|uniref:hypothetical protein n=1 Tax=Nonomuraea sp. LPB2021202275-12-8 TaxID=3120159 RepID=UPI00300D8C33
MTSGDLGTTAAGVRLWVCSKAGRCSAIPNNTAGEGYDWPFWGRDLEPVGVTTMVAQVMCSLPVNQWSPLITRCTGLLSRVDRMLSMIVRSGYRCDRT